MGKGLVVKTNSGYWPHSTRPRWFAVEFFAAGRDQPGSFSNPRIRQGIKRGIPLGESVGEITFNISARGANAQLVFGSQMTLPIGEGIGQILILKSLLLLREKIPRVKSVYFHSTRMPLERAIRIFRWKIRKDGFEFSPRKQTANMGNVSERKDTRRIEKSIARAKPYRMRPFRA